MTAPGLYELAHLAGGPARVVDTALVALVESGRVRVHAPGELAVVEPARSHPVEAAVMDAVGTHGHRSVDTVRWRLDGDERLLELARSLAAAGLARRRLRLGRASPASWSPTAAGREALQQAREHPPTDRRLDGGSALAVALDGRQAMADRRLCSEIFERPLPPLPRTSGMARRLRDAGLHDPEQAAYRGHHTTIGGAATIGFLGGGDGGGF